MFLCFWVFLEFFVKFLRGEGKFVVWVGGGLRNERDGVCVTLFLGFFLFCSNFEKFLQLLFLVDSGSSSKNSSNAV